MWTSEVKANILYRGSKVITIDPQDKELYLKLLPPPKEEHPSMLTVCSCPTMVDFASQNDIILNTVLPKRQYTMEFMDRRCRKKSRSVVRDLFPRGLNKTFHDKFDVIWFCGCNKFLAHGKALEHMMHF